LVTLLFPPLGLFVLWRAPLKFRSKLLGTLGIALFSLLYAALIIFLLVRFTGLQIEWRGGYIPALTYQKTAPNYEALEKQRARQLEPQPARQSPGPGYLSSKQGDLESSWPGFRGPTRDGHYDESAILTNWPAGGLRLLWHQPIGGGYASFAVAEDKAFTIEQRREEEVIAAYNVETGGEIWTHRWKDKFSDSYAEDGPRATPAYSDRKIYAFGAMGELRCLEAATGKATWSRNVLVENKGQVPAYGMAASPLIIEEKLIVLTGPGHGQSVACYDKRDGKIIWSALDDPMGYASPMLVTLAGEKQLIICAETRTLGLRPKDGNVLWEYPWRVLHDQNPIAQPVMLGTNRFLLSAGYFTGCVAVEIARTGTSFVASKLWQNKNLKNKFTSSVFWQGHIYGLDEDILTCLDAETGERKWKEGRYGYGQLLLASGHLIILSGDGELALVRATPERHEELARFPAIHGKTWNHPAIANGKIFVRNSAEMACFDISAPKTSP
jgi:outer membrane protein assembly factor BamB